MKSLIGLIILVLDIIAIMELLKSKTNTGKKILWIILIIILPLIGLILYYLLGRKENN